MALKYNNKPKKVDGIKFRSKLEVYCYEALLDSGLEFEYEPESITLIPSFRYEPECWEKIGRNPKEFKQQRQSIRGISYTPDFVGDSWIIETKGFFTEAARMRWKLFKLWLAENNKSWQLYMPTNKKEIIKTIDLIKGINESPESDATKNRKNNRKRPKTRKKRKSNSTRKK